METYFHFIFNWTTYFCSAPILFFIMLVIGKISSNEVTYEDIVLSLIVGLSNPLMYICIPIAISIILCYLIVKLTIIIDKKWSKIKDKKVF